MNLREDLSRTGAGNDFCAWNHLPGGIFAERTCFSLNRDLHRRKLACLRAKIRAGLCLSLRLSLRLLRLKFSSQKHTEKNRKVREERSAAAISIGPSRCLA